MLHGCNNNGILLLGSNTTKKEVKTTVVLLKEARQAKGFTQEQLAKASGVHRVTIARIESGKCFPNMDTLEKLASALGVTVSDLVAFTR